MHLQRHAEHLLLHRTHFQRPAEQPTPQTVDSLLWYATHFQRRAVPKAASCRSGSRFSARNGPRSEVSRHKKRVVIKVYQDFLISLYQSLFRSFFDIRQELSTHACTLAKRPGKAGCGHLSALPCTAALFAHVPSAHHKSHAERWMLLSQCFSKHLHHIMDKSFLNLQTGRAIIYNPSYF